MGDAVAEFDMELVPKRGDCATDTMNCITAKCCEKSGAKCFRKDAGYAKCAMKCPGGGWSCYEEKATWANKPAIRHLDASLFCFTVYVQNKGEGLVNKKDLAILQKAFQYQESLFSCNDWEVFSDVPAQISLDKGYWSTVVSDADGTFKSLRRKDKPDHYLNTPLFIQVWKALAQQQRWSRQSFTVKVDPTTVFFPAKLRTYLASKTDEPANGYYMQNCKSVKQGFFGNLEVVSKQAMTIFLQRADSCTASCWQSRRFRRHYQRHLPREQAQSAEEKLNLRATLLEQLHASCHPPLQDTRGILHVPWNNYGPELCVGNRIFFPGGARSWAARDADLQWIAAMLATLVEFGHAWVAVPSQMLKCATLRPALELLGRMTVKRIMALFLKTNMHWRHIKNNERG